MNALFAVFRGKYILEKFDFVIFLVFFALIRLCANILLCDTSYLQSSRKYNRIYNN